MTSSYSVQIHYIFLGNNFILGCNNSLANSLVRYELKCLS